MEIEEFLKTYSLTTDVFHFKKREVVDCVGGDKDLMCDECPIYNPNSNGGMEECAVKYKRLKNIKIWKSKSS